MRAITMLLVYAFFIYLQLEYKLRRIMRFFRFILIKAFFIQYKLFIIIIKS